MARAERQDRDAGSSPRRLRVGEEVRHVLADVLLHGDLRDPALSGRSITVSEVRMSPDLRRATAYVLPLGGSDGKAVLEGLARASGFLRREVGRKVRLRLVPEIDFALDTAFDNATHVETLLRTLPPGRPEDDDAP
jgi:ribosome-binding factor A